MIRFSLLPSLIVNQSQQIIVFIDRYAMMTDCWMEKPEDRPNFTALVQRLDHVMESNSAAMVSAS